MRFTVTGCNLTQTRIIELQLESLLSEIVYEGEAVVELQFSTLSFPLRVHFSLTGNPQTWDTYTTEIRMNSETIRELYDALDYELYKGDSVKLILVKRIDSPLILSGVEEISLSQGVISISHRNYDLGLSNKYSVLDGTHLVLINLSRCNFLKSRNDFRELSYKGTITYRNDDGYTRRAISSEMGDIELALCYEYEHNLRIEGKKALLQYESPRITVTPKDIRTDPQNAVVNIERELEDLLTLLSFFSRENTVVKGVALYLKNEEGKVLNSLKRIRTAQVSSRSLGPMYRIENFSDQELEDLLTRFAMCPQHDSLTRAIPMVNLSYQTSDLASAYFLVHAALEAVCKDFTVDLRGKKIEGVPVRDYQRVLISTRRLGIDLSSYGIWRTEGVSEGLKRAFAQRNELFHELKMSDLDSLHSNLRHFRQIFELVACKLLKVDYSFSTPQHVVA